MPSNPILLTDDDGDASTTQRTPGMKYNET